MNTPLRSNATNALRGILLQAIQHFKPQIMAQEMNLIQRSMTAMGVSFAENYVQNSFSDEDAAHLFTWAEYLVQMKAKYDGGIQGNTDAEIHTERHASLPLLHALPENTLHS